MKRKIVSMLLAGTLTAVLLTGCGGTGTTTNENKKTEESGNSISTEVSYIVLSDEEIMVDGKKVTTETTDAVYVANDIVFYLEGQDFTYGEGTKEQEHSQEEADKHTVVHITKPGTYSFSGSLSAGQIAVDLGEEAENDPEAVVTLILDNADITCSVAPAVIFYNVYECGTTDEENAVKDVDTSKAGANVIIADGSSNTINGSHVARIYKSVELSEDGTKVVDSKKLHKYDAAFYSKMSMNINGGTEGTGILNIQADNEGLDTELHLTINGGNINITSGNDGINTNEDNVSVTTINGGSLNITVEGSTGEGDGIDSNGWLVINGGTVTTSACGTSMDGGIDSDKGIHINGGTVVAGGNMMDSISESNQNYMVLSFSEKVSGEDKIVMKNEAGEVVGEWALANNYTYLVVSMPQLTEGTYTLWKNETQLSGIAMDGNMGYGMMMPGGQRPNMPANGEMPQLPEGMEIPNMSENGERPKRAEKGQNMENFQNQEGNQQPPEWMDFEELPEGGKQPAGRQNPMQSQSVEGLKNASKEFVIKNGGNIFMVVS